MIQILLEFCGKHLIVFMAAMMALCFIIRWFCYQSSKKNDAYFSTLAREITIAIEKDKEDVKLTDKEAQAKVTDVESYLGQFFSGITDKLPNRSLRFKEDLQQSSPRNMVSIDNYLNGKENFINILKGEAGVFHCQTPPNFSELTQRILGQDRHWSTMFKHLPVDGISRLIDIMPGLFVVFGVFGTFVGISMALPEIAKIDFNNIDGSGETLTNFVLNTAYAMETSLAGIVFSVMMTFMNTLFPIKDMRYRIHKKVETSLQNLWYHIHHATKAENELAKTLRAIHMVLEKMALKEEQSPVLPENKEQKAS